jgi:hypothetical protein
MAAAGSPDDLGREEQIRLSANITRAPTVKRVLRSIGVGSAALFGALLSGFIVLIQGIIALMELSFHLRRAGLIDTWARGILFAGRSLDGLIIAVVLAAFAGAIVWAIGALLYNLIAFVGGGIKLTFEERGQPGMRR